ncbi:hypothetical protein INR49_026253 [Caranx melampygus]|nr:hypothetical protein INR49_026253 [Caranx melampygus]
MEKSPTSRALGVTAESWRNASVSPLHGRGWLTDFVLAGAGLVQSGSSSRRIFNVIVPLSS